MKKYTILTAALLLLSFSVASARTGSSFRPVSLTCEYVTDPMAIDVAHPRLSWVNEYSRRPVNGARQTAYEIRVASRGHSLRKADLWQSGKCSGDNSFLVKYDGAALQSGMDCRWQVRVWDSEGKVSRWSRPARWGMGFMSADEWKAEWIGAPWEPEAGRPGTENNAWSPCPLLRKSFEVGSKVVSAKAYVTGVGLFEFYLNGKKVGDEVLTPNETSWGYIPGLDKKSIPVNGDNFRDYHILYYVYDITSMLHKGLNVAGAIVGNGFFNAVSYWVANYGAPRFIGQIVIEYADGTTDTIVSDESWLAHKSPIVLNDMWEGEVYDASMEVSGWCDKSLKSLDGWEPAAVRKAPGGKLCGHYYTSDRINERISPKSITRQDDGSWEVDFGDYISGWVHFRDMKGNAGDTLTVKYLSESKGNGPNLYIFKGAGKEEYAPRFTWAAFDKVNVSGVSALEARNMVAEAVYTDVAVTGKFECSNPLFNRINHIWWRSQTDNMHLGVATDCPHRERGPYTGDGEVACVTVMHNLDAAAFYTKWLRDMSDCQDVETGYVPNGAPWHPGCGGGVGWGAAMDIIPWEFYLHYGDRDLLSGYYFQMKEYVRWMRNWITPEGIMFQKMPLNAEKSIYWMNLGDWLPPYELPKDELVHTFLLWKCCDYTARAAHALGEAEDEQTYRCYADEVAAAFHKVFYDEDTASYGDYGSNIMALKMGVPQGCKDAVIETLKAEIARYGGHLNTGIVGTQLFFEVLAENGLNELAFEAMNKRDFPSFGWWIEQGAYTTWEQWDGRNSRNHPMFGGALTWFYRKVAGMEADENAPGYKHIIFRPMPCGDLTWASYSTRTPYGEASIRWDRPGDGSFKLKIAVPVGSTATVILPSADGKIVYEVGSGSYEYETKI